MFEVAPTVRGHGDDVHDRPPGNLEDFARHRIHTLEDHLRVRHRPLRAQGGRDLVQIALSLATIRLRVGDVRQNDAKWPDWPQNHTDEMDLERSGSGDAAELHEGRFGERRAIQGYKDAPG